MHPTAVMLVVLGSLGCQNPEPTVPAAPAITAEKPATPPAGEQPATPPPAVAAPAMPDVAVEPGSPSMASVPAEMIPYSLPSYYGGPYPFDVPENPTFGQCLRDTLYSFVVGRSPGVPSAKEIMSAYQAGLYSH